ncbi:PREDICTED: leucine-rich repeat-containing protein 70-like isoform X1 [Papilio xuthus]|uniref:Leucine-rich repeat-containing protein 70-like isoform X1 n=1 Tax=Papilio xuthus TaxID=66420 RepID=A0AAJ6Z613_PAPXU|nr:PREDICTED: leucine-rich repeat-containing protein 70-like isoform X1 [Papilio xuthus]XP_013166045.1 PREDICTED: leucine-rich repeat-containing protein 70-like isoform X1 [Papilio xuthus]
MRRALVFLALAAACCATRGWTFCDAPGECVCRYHERAEEDLMRQHIDCSYGRGAHAANRTLPPRAHSLDLSSSGLKIIRSGPFLRSKSLQELGLKNNDITYIEPDGLALPDLRRLDLSYNRLERLDAAVFRSITKLEFLNLANNNFVSFAKLTFHPLRELREVILNNNNIGPALRDTDLFDRDGFGLTNKIQKVSIGGIGLGRVHSNFFVDAYDIRELVITNNELRELFEIPFTLEYLDVSDNPIREISGEDFTDLTALKVLKMNNLGIGSVPAYALEPLRALVRLDLERNLNLSEFSALAFGQEVLEDADDFTLEELSLKSSRLQTLDRRLQVPLGRLSRLDLQGNRWHCDCRLAWIKQFQMKANDYEHLRCYTPKSLFNSKIFELKEKYFRCPRERGGGGVGSGMAVGLIAFCMFSSAAALWLFWYLPGCPPRGRALPTAAYSALPLHAPTATIAPTAL